MILEEYTWFPDDLDGESEIVFIRAKDCCEDHAAPEDFTLSGASNISEEAFDEIFDHLEENSIQDPGQLDEYVNKVMNRHQQDGESNES